MDATNANETAQSVNHPTRERRQRLLQRVGRKPEEE
jgi:hypothetical protein